MDQAVEQNDGYIKTAAHNYVSRAATIHGSKQVEMKGKSIIHPQTCIRGDFAAIRIGRYCHIGSNVLLRPPSFQTRLNTPHHGDNVQYLPLLIGNHTRIGDNCIIECASIGSSVVIGKNCVLGKRVLIKDNVVVQDGTVLADDTVIPPFSRVGGCPGKILSDFWDGGTGVMIGGMLPESVSVEFVNDCTDKFSTFVRELEATSSRG